MFVSEYVNSGRARFIWKDYSFLGQESTWAAEAARCANDQGKFWAYHDYLYNHQGSENLIIPPGRVSPGFNPSNADLNVS